MDDEVSIGGGTLLFVFAASVFAAPICGLMPAIRFSAPSLSRQREGGRGAVRSRHVGRNVLVAAQTALALVLLIGSALLLRSFDQLSHIDPGYDTEDLFTFQIAPEGPHLQDPPSGWRLPGCRRGARHGWIRWSRCGWSEASGLDAVLLAQ